MPPYIIRMTKSNDPAIAGALRVSCHCPYCAPDEPCSLHTVAAGLGLPREGQAWLKRQGRR